MNKNGRNEITIGDEYALYRGVMAAVAKKLGVSRSYVSRAARGERHSPAIEKELEKALARVRQEQMKIRQQRVGG